MNFVLTGVPQEWHRGGYKKINLIPSFCYTKILSSFYLHLHQTCSWQLNIWHPPNHPKSIHSAWKNSPCFNWYTFPITCLQCSIHMHLSAQQLCLLTWQIVCSKSHWSSSHHPSGILVPLWTKSMLMAKRYTTFFPSLMFCLAFAASSKPTLDDIISFMIFQPCI